MQLSTGPWSYNRFDKFESTLTEGSKPDFLDMDKDGDKKEPMKKAIKEKGDKKECDDCGKKDCDCDDKKPAFLKKKDMKEAIIANLMADGLANNAVSAEIIAEHMSDEWVEAILDDLAD